MEPIPNKRLVVGLSTRALFNLDAENALFEQVGLESFFGYQRDHESDPLSPGLAFPLAKALLELGDEVVELVIMSRNHPQVALRVFHSIDAHKLKIDRAALVGGAPLAPYLEAFGVDLFLSANEADVQAAVDSGYASGLIEPAPMEPPTAIDQIRIAFDGDCVLFSDEAQRICDEEGVEAFIEYERAKAKETLPDGPFAKLFRLISQVQVADPDKSPFRIALVTARQISVHERALRTFDAWGVRIDEGFFLKGDPKDRVLRAFRPHIFFDDQEKNCKQAGPFVPTARVPRTTRVLAPHEDIVISASLGASADGELTFLLVCKKVLKSGYQDHEQELQEWYQSSLGGLSPAQRAAFLSEFDESAVGTPKGRQRRSSSKSNSDVVKLMTFLRRLSTKHSSS